MNTRLKILATCMLLLGGLAFEAQAQSSSEADEILATGGGGGAIKKGEGQPAPSTKTSTKAGATGKSRAKVRIAPVTPSDVEYLDDSTYRSRESLCKTFQEHLGTFVPLLSLFLERYPTRHSGAVVFQLTVSPDGNVVESKVARTNAYDPEIQPELETRCRSMKFESIPSGNVVFRMIVFFHETRR